jgi:glutamate-5-semialdehyde dehydrogenase
VKIGGCPIVLSLDLNMTGPFEFKDVSVATLARRAREASRVLARLPDEVRRDALLKAAYALVEQRAGIVLANERDCEGARAQMDRGLMSTSLFARLQTSERGISEMADKMRQVAQLPDPINRVLTRSELDNGLILEKVSCPLGVIGIVFESRPDVIPQVVALTLRSGNAVLLKGGVEAVHTNEALVSVLRHAFAALQIPYDTLNLLHTREDVAQMLTLENEIDLIVPRGSKEFVHYVASHSKVPVLGHGEGICHVYVDAAADLKKALDIALDSKVQYPAACNAAETLLIHTEIAPLFLPEMLSAFMEAGVIVYGCPDTRAFAGSSNLLPASEADWASEYSDLRIAIKVVASLDSAIAHINQYGSKHTEAIVTEDEDTAKRFMDEVDASGVYHNVSTRFADGYRYGLGAEIGISTSKLHARGPVGLEGLTTYKYKLSGNGHIVANFRRT